LALPSGRFSNRKEFSQLHTRINGEGICLQNTGYTCGPASVTMLRRLGFSAEEGENAVLSQTSSFTGTPPDLLAGALRQKYGRDGLIMDYRFFKNLDELQQAGVILAVTVVAAEVQRQFRPRHSRNNSRSRTPQPEQKIVPAAFC